MKTLLKKSYLTLVYLFLYVPILVLIVYSFNAAKYATVWKGATLKWYTKLFENQMLMDAMINSITVAVASSIVATAIGTLGALAFYRYRFAGRRPLYAMVYTTMMSPDIVMGISLLCLFIFLGLKLGFITLLLAHVTFCLPFVIVTVYARISGFDPAVIDAAKDLGAGEFQIFRRVILPMTAPAVVAGWLLSFTLSLDDVIVSFFVTGPDFEILPLKIYSMVRLGVKPEVNALCTLMFIFTLLTVMAAHFLVKEKN
ncbi:MAG: spermidine/putrescine ABC transporter permease PotC [Desulfobacterales bacterium]|nr:spermidine/putrescine ABC transporter permease PotC [Desulfobacterales bacterium]